MTAIAHSADESRALRPGSGRAVAMVVIFAVLLGLLGYGIYGHAATSHATLGAGNPAKWLPEQQLARPVDQTLVGTAAKPAITVCGDDVRIQTPTFSALATVTGPTVPGEGLSYQPQYVTSTWTVEIWDVKGSVPLSAKDFDATSHTGAEYQLHVPQGSTMPTTVASGGQASFELRAVVPVGESMVRWAPNGNNIVAKWDNQVEND